MADELAFGSITQKQLVSDGAGGLWIPAQSLFGAPELFRYARGQLAAVNLGATSNSVSRIPGTKEALSGGFQAGNGGTGTWIVQQYSWRVMRNPDYW